MGNSRFEHIVATIHNMNGSPVTVDTQLEDLGSFVGQESTYNARATAFNINTLRDDDDFFEFSRVFEFELEDSQNSTTTIFSFSDTSDYSDPKLCGCPI